MVFTGRLMTYTWNVCDICKGPPSLSALPPSSHRGDLHSVTAVCYAFPLVLVRKVSGAWAAHKIHVPCKRSRRNASSSGRGLFSACSSGRLRSLTVTSISLLVFMTFLPL